MAKKKRTRRIEPTFGSPARQGRSTGRAAAGGTGRPASSRRKGGKGRRKTTSRRRGGARRGLFRLVRAAAYWSLVLALWAGIAGAGLAAWYGAQLPSATAWTIPDRPPNVRIVSVDGKLLANRGMTGGQAVGLHEMSPHIAQAVVAIEDQRFYGHFGVDPLGMARAAVENVLTGRLSQGGSTITQQLAKNLFLEPDRTIKRKVQEALLALWLEREYTKSQILEMYLNRVYFGSGAYGVEAASRRYFDRPARDVTLSEAALLAGLLKAPSRLSPARDPQAAEERAQLVLTAMREQGMIGDSELATAMSAPATRAAAYWTGSQHYVADRVMEELPDLVGDVRSDVVVETTVDFGLQKVAEGSIRRLIDDKGAELDVAQGALVSLDGSGAVRAMVGGHNYANSQFDRAFEARRQPGSAFKPFVYMAALEAGMTPGSVRNDAPVTIGKWTPGNYRGKFHGPVTLTEALSKSLNSVSAQLTMEVGPDAVVEAAQRMGIVSPLKANASIALGTSEVTPMELTAAYVPFANGGRRPAVHLVSRVSDADGEVLYEHPRAGLPRVVRPETVAMMNAMMSRTIEEGTGRAAAFGWPAAGKTGTSQKSRDAWFVGYTSNLVTGVWFGNDDGTPTARVTGGMLPAIAWREFMVAAHEGVPVADLPGEWVPRPAEDVAGASAPDLPAAAPGSPRPEPAPTRRSRADTDQTSSIRRPPGEVGSSSRGERRSIVDIILGN